jgi:exonuclease SbcD
MAGMKILHTSDWHLGRSLYGRKRYSEFAAFLDWLADCIRQQEIDVLLVAGDIFDTATPSNKAQQLYYRFLCTVAGSCCRHIVVIGGNHDSPSFLNAPRELLRTLNVHVVGAITDDFNDEIVVLQDSSNEPEAVVCAVPYLRDRDIRTAAAGETIAEKGEKLAEGIRSHYREVCALAEQQRRKLGNIPLLAMGHLFTSGSRTVEDDGVRELYVGSLAHVGADGFPDCIDYLALGHLHVPQRVGSSDHIRYCGSPIAMGFGEANQRKRVIQIEFTGTQPAVEEIFVPCFQPLVRLSGSLQDIVEGIGELKNEQSNSWLEIEYTGAEIVGNLREQIEEALLESDMEVRRIKNRRMVERVINTINQDETLDDLNEQDVFDRCLDTFEVPDGEREELTRSYNEILLALAEQDENAE